ncbi:cellulose biosynthesis protein BcsE [Burkholderia oklahomensis]|uniref:Cellulose biosynthesis protein BcsE n=3 Tax=Burkholderia oklahomensis TaxID=342113 RepID=A0AAI8FSG0_9BURK|nr:cellulose biosynthesis protein BcsE [Burkholderia oklahomensis]AIO70962.1 cellulose biosynthesis protein BcsE [Burkholderia oklahomensis]KUY65630.1 cellulose biosynthesis protein BcsE [Burkholderia oklahomensis EO147]
MNDSRVKSDPTFIRSERDAAEAGALGRLRALWRAWSRAVTPRDRAAAPNRLAIDALPDEWTELAPGGLYAVYAAARTLACDALIWESVRHARTRDVTVVLARERADVAARLREIGFGEDVHARGWPRRLNVLAMPPDDAIADADADANDAMRADSADVATRAGLDARAARRGAEGDAGADASGAGASSGVSVSSSSSVSDVSDVRGVHVVSDASEDKDATDVSEAPDALNAQQRAAPPPAAFARLVGGLRALKRYRFRANALYFVEGAERWFSWHDPVALTQEGRALAGWCRAHRIALVLLIDSQAADADANRAGGARAIASRAAVAVRDEARAKARAKARTEARTEARTKDRTKDRAAAFAGDGARSARGGFHGACAGVAQLQRTHGELRWMVDFWRSRGAVATGEVRALRFTGGGRLTAVGAAGAHALRGDARLAFDEARVVVCRRVVERESWVPGDWDVVDDNAAVLAACEGAHAATAVLAFTGRAQLEALCSAIHALRLRCGGALKIVVVERGEALRHQFELLALNLGANQVVARNLPFSRVLAVLRSLQGQLYARPVAADYRAALAASLGDTVLGYLPVAAFCAHARAVRERSTVLALSHTLVKLTLLPGVSHADALRACALRRAGDVLTADAQHLYLFLFACELADASDVLGYIFSVPVERISDRVAHLAEESIEHELSALDAANRRAPIADYSDLFSAAAVVKSGPDARTTIEHSVTPRIEIPPDERMPRHAPGTSTPTSARSASHTPPRRPTLPVSPISPVSRAPTETAQIVVPSSPVPIASIATPRSAHPLPSPAAGAIVHARTRTRTATRDVMPLRIKEAE